jgi:hypothetical protein
MAGLCRNISVEYCRRTQGAAISIIRKIKNRIFAAQSRGQRRWGRSEKSFLTPSTPEKSRKSLFLMTLQYMMAFDDKYSSVDVVRCSASTLLTVYTISFCRQAPFGPRRFRHCLIFAMCWYSVATTLAEALHFLVQPSPHGHFPTSVARVLTYAWRAQLHRFRSSLCPVAPR